MSQGEQPSSLETWFKYGDQEPPPQKQAQPQLTIEAQAYLLLGQKMGEQIGIQKGIQSTLPQSPGEHFKRPIQDAINQIAVITAAQAGKEIGDSFAQWWFGVGQQPPSQPGKTFSEQVKHTAETGKRAAQTGKQTVQRFGRVVAAAAGWAANEWAQRRTNPSQASSSTPPPEGEVVEGTFREVKD